MAEYYKESYLEETLRDQVRKMGGMCVKFVSPGTNGMPDRMAVMPGGHVFFIELKSTGQKPKPHQAVIHKRMQALGLYVCVIDNLPDLNKFLDELRSLPLPGIRG